jgi:hypothetical protein
MKISRDAGTGTGEPDMSSAVLWHGDIGTVADSEQ